MCDGFIFLFMDTGCVKDASFLYITCLSFWLLSDIMMISIFYYKLIKTMHTKWHLSQSSIEHSCSTNPFLHSNKLKKKKKNLCLYTNFLKSLKVQYNFSTFLLTAAVADDNGGGQATELGAGRDRAEDPGYRCGGKETRGHPGGHCGGGV